MRGLKDLFRNLDSLCSEGKLPESLFDSEGEIVSEDISCAKCYSKELSSNNDLILRDGVCDRGFHQLCSNPPLLTEDIPPGDEGWLCPGCDCKDDCMDLINDSFGTSLTISDAWEKIFPEAAAALEYISEWTPPKENGPASPSDHDVAMADACSASVNKVSTSTRGASFIEGISKSSYMKHAPDIKGSAVKVLNCHESAICILAPLRYAIVYGCSDATIVLGAVGKAVRVEHCERVRVIIATKHICIANCRECVFFLGVNQQPLIVGDNHKLQEAPYNTFYSHLEEHMDEVGIVPTVSRWDEPLALGMVDPHDSLSHPAGVS